jgi:AbrB family looped-hinge helix DNA binding protein
MRNWAQVRVKRKGQVTIPSELRLKLGIDEGALLEVEEQKGAIVLRPETALRVGKSWAKARTSKSLMNLTD